MYDNVETPQKIMEFARCYAGIESVEEFLKMVNNSDVRVLNVLKYATKEIMKPDLDIMSDEKLAKLRDSYREEYMDTVYNMDRWRFNEPELYAEQLTKLDIGQYINKYIETKENAPKQAQEQFAKKPQKGIISKIKDFLFGEDD